MTGKKRHTLTAARRRQPAGAKHRKVCWPSHAARASARSTARARAPRTCCTCTAQARRPPKRHGAPRACAVLSSFIAALGSCSTLASAVPTASVPPWRT
eukprot:8632919-Lingulodinium_polyedra.AAC.1